MLSNYDFVGQNILDLVNAMVSPGNVPVHPLSDYGPGMSAGQQFFIGRFEQSVTSRPNRLRFHRHSYHEAFLVDGKGSYFADFEEYGIAGPTLIFVSPGQVHRWNQKPRMTGPMICFLRSFMTERSHRRVLLSIFLLVSFSKLHPTDIETQVSQDPILSLAEMEAEATRSKERDDIAEVLCPSPGALL